MRSSEDFRQATRHGVRAGRSTLVVHAARTGFAGVRVGFVVGRPVGPAVVRNRVKRRLRHLAASLIDRTPAGVDVVVRALPSAATARETLADDLSSAWQRALKRLASSADDPARSQSGRP
jgi:ribonuclease P protein component